MKLGRTLAVLTALAVFLGCKRENKLDGPIASTPITTKATPAGQPKATPEPKPDPKPPIFKDKDKLPVGGLNLSREEEQLLGQMDQARDQAKLPRLKPSPVLMQLAKEHAAKMLGGKDPLNVTQPPGYLMFG